MWYLAVSKIHSLAIPVCLHLASLVMPIGDPPDDFFYPTLTLMMDSYKLISESRVGNMGSLAWKITSDYWFALKYLYEPSREAIGQIASRGKFVQPSVKYIDY